MAGGARLGSSSAAAPLAGPPAPGTHRFSGAFRSRRRQLTQIPINPPALAWGRRSASGRRGRPISSRPPCSALPGHSAPRAPVTHACSAPATERAPGFAASAEHQPPVTSTTHRGREREPVATRAMHKISRLSRANGVHPAFALRTRSLNTTDEKQLHKKERWLRIDSQNWGRRPVRT